MLRLIGFEHDMKRNSKAFTLAELLIVILIISILASLAIPRFFGQTEKARTSEAINMLGAIRRAQLNYYDANQDYAVIGDNCSSGIPLPNAPSFEKTLGIKMAACTDLSWSYKTDKTGTIATATRQKRNNETGTPPKGTLTITADGTWGGTSEYAGPAEPRGKYWPF